MADELILVVEDNELNRKLVCDTLEFAGLRVISAATAAEGVALALQEHPQLILMDIGLPDRDGVAALDSLRAHPATKSIPVVAVTAYAMQGDQETLLQKGFDGYLAKPIDVRLLPAQVDAFLKDTQSRPPAASQSQTPILVVDDTPANARLLEAVLVPHGYSVLTASSGEEGLALVSRHRPHVVLLDVVMPDIDGYEVCRRIRANPSTATTAVVMVTASVGRERLQALEAGADDFVAKPINQAELLARIRNLVKSRSYQDRVESQAAELAQLNRTLQERVSEQVLELERLRHLRRFVTPQVADAILSAGSDEILRFHRSEIAVLFCDLRGFTGFAANAEPEESARIMTEYHKEVGALVQAFDATVGHFAGDGIMLFFNDPIPCPDPLLRAVELGVALRDRVEVLSQSWGREGYRVGFGIGVAWGFATLGEMGFEDRREYSAVGSVCNLASRLCDEAETGQILLTARAHEGLRDRIRAEPIPPLYLKGFAEPVEAWNVLAIEPGRADP